MKLVNEVSVQAQAQGQGHRDLIHKLFSQRPAAEVSALVPVPVPAAERIPQHSL